MSLFQEGNDHLYMSLFQEGNDHFEKERKRANFGVRGAILP